MQYNISKQNHCNISYCYLAKKASSDSELLLFSLVRIISKMTCLYWEKSFQIKVTCKSQKCCSYILAKKTVKRRSSQKVRKSSFFVCNTHGTERRTDKVRFGFAHFYSDFDTGSQYGWTKQSFLDGHYSLSMNAIDGRDLELTCF